MVDRTLLVYLVLLTSSVPLVLAQQPKNLGIQETVTLSIPERRGGFAVQLPIKCSPNGEIYVRFTYADSEPELTRISEDGRHISLLRLNRVPEFSDAGIYDFAPGDDGEMFFLTGHGAPHIPTTYYVAHFRRDGAYDSSLRLDTTFRRDFEPMQLAAFSTGEFFVAGFAKGHSNALEPFTAMFTAGGQFQRELVLPGDVGKKEITIADASPGQSLTEEEGLRGLLEISHLQLADDGNVYLMRNTPQGPVFAISAGGMVQRIPLDLPPEN